MSKGDLGSLERKSSAFSIYVHSLEDYVNEVIASKHGKNVTNVPKQVIDSIQNSILANIHYHNYICEAQRKIGETSMCEYHTVMADTYRALKTN